MGGEGARRRARVRCPATLRRAGVVRLADRGRARASWMVVRERADGGAYRSDRDTVWSRAAASNRSRDADALLRGGG